MSADVSGREAGPAAGKAADAAGAPSQVASSRLAAKSVDPDLPAAFQPTRRVGFVLLKAYLRTQH
jgi:hypothetical protein